ncbi:MAG: hypothetical protein QOG90_1229 [Actinomycetota bacterium]|jgi:subtilase family serine protease
MRARFLLLSVAVALGATALPLTEAHAAPPPDSPSYAHHAVCAPGAAGTARCHADVRVNGKGAPLATTSPAGSAYTPSDLRGAYNLGTGTPPNAQTVAIVDAYDNPNAESDLAAYRSFYGLRDCTTANGCFRKIDQRGTTITATTHPTPDVGWGQEIALDLDMASAICPGCNILLVEADSSAFTNLAAGVDRAVLSGATVVSNSYGGPEFSGEATATYNGHYNHPGVAVTVSTGDSGYGVEFPASSQYVTAVGGTSLNWDRATHSRVSETAWSGAGSGCSAYIARPAWQSAVGTCGRRMVADVSAVADPNTGVTVYDSYGSSGGANWYVFGGTSVAAPIVASVYALAGNASSIAVGSVYSATTGLFDITSGSNGRCTTKRSSANKALCTAVAGWDGPTGRGTPNGLSAF